MNNQDLMWFVGLFEGEGCFVFSKGKPQRLAISMTDKDVIDRVQTLAGGSVFPLKMRKPHWKQAWIWVLKGQESLELTKLMLPHLGARRRARGEEYFSLYYSLREARRIAQKQAKAELLQEMNRLRALGMTHQAIADTLGYDRSSISRLFRDNPMVGMV